MKSAKPSSIAKKITRKTVARTPYYKYNGKLWTSFTGEAATAKAPFEREASEDSLKVLTYNVWFGPQWQKERAMALFDIVQEKNADVVAFQEVTKPFLKWLLDEEWVRNGYLVSDNQSGATFGRYGVVLMTKLPVYSSCIIADFGKKSRMGRKFVAAEVHLSGAMACIGTSHLESYAKDVGYRADQMEIVSAVLAQEEYSFCSFMGDSNMLHPEVEELPGKYQLQDAWADLYPDDPGYTFDNRTNTNIRERDVVIRNRIDISLYRNVSEKAVWRPFHAEVLGKKAVEVASDEFAFPSDHYGLFVEYRKS